MDEYEKEDRRKEKSEAFQEIKRLKARLRRAYYLTKQRKNRKKGLEFFKAVAWCVQGFMIIKKKVIQKYIEVHAERAADFEQVFTKYTFFVLQYL